MAALEDAGDRFVRARIEPEGRRTYARRVPAQVLIDQDGAGLRRRPEADRGSGGADLGAPPGEGPREINGDQDQEAFVYIFMKSLALVIVFVVKVLGASRPGFKIIVAQGVEVEIVAVVVVDQEGFRGQRGEDQCR